mmetsp:Transcript_71117/g.118935  ORF Transcript_71117/g.118935 Transcript_71117/m.118935 type:complete len:153 (-) Transcript_71117:38-496(-)
MAPSRGLASCQHPPNTHQGSSPCEQATGEPDPGQHSFGTATVQPPGRGQRSKQASKIAGSQATHATQILQKRIRLEADSAVMLLHTCDAPHAPQRTWLEQAEDPPPPRKQTHTTTSKIKHGILPKATRPWVCGETSESNMQIQNHQQCDEFI